MKDPEYQAKLKAQKAIVSLKKGAEFKTYVEGLYSMVRDLKPLMDADINK